MSHITGIYCYIKNNIVELGGIGQLENKICFYFTHSQKITMDYLKKCRKLIDGDNNKYTKKYIYQCIANSKDEK